MTSRFETNKRMKEIISAVIFFSLSLMQEKKRCLYGVTDIRLKLSGCITIYPCLQQKRKIRNCFELAEAEISLSNRVFPRNEAYVV